MDTTKRLGVIRNFAGWSGRQAFYIAGGTGIKGWARIASGSARAIYGPIARTWRDFRHGVPEGVIAERKREFMMALEGVTREEYWALQRGWQVESRWWYLFALLLLIGSGSAVMTDYGGALTLLNGATLSSYLFVRGLVASYRAWQLSEQVFFQPGSFSSWLKSGAWLV